MIQPSDEQARFEILLEEVRSGLRVVAEGHGLLDRKIERLDQKVERLDQKVDHGFAILGQRIGFVEAAVLDLRGDLRRLDQRFVEHLSTHPA